MAEVINIGIEEDWRGEKKAAAGIRNLTGIGFG